MSQSDTVLVVGNDGMRGRLIPGAAPASVGGEPQALVQLDNGGQVVVPASSLRQQPDGSYYLPLGLAELERQSQYQASSNAVRNDGQPLVVPVMAEELNVQRRQVNTGGVRVRKVVREHEEIVDQPMLREEVNVERVPVNQMVAGGPPQVRYEGDTMVIPILEEVLVVEKRLVVKEEIRITRRQTTASQPQHITLMSEEAIVERMDAPQAPLPPNANNSGQQQ